MRFNVRAVTIAASALLFAASAASAQATATWYIGTYTNDVLVWDEASEQLVDRIAMKNFFPIGVTVNESKTRLYVEDASMQRIEVVDLATNEAIDGFTLSHDSVTVRFEGSAFHPDDTKAVFLVKRTTKMSDRFLVEGPFILEYDMRTKQVTDTVPFPDGESRDAVGFQYSPDGRTLYMFADDIIAVDAETYEEVDRWEISKPLEPGLGSLNFGVTPGTYDEPGVATSLIRMRDPVQNRSLMGIAQVRLDEQDVDFFMLGPTEPVSGGRGFALAPGGQKAYALYSTVGRYEFWEFDLAAQRVTRKVPFAGRPRMGLRVSADGEKLYVFVAGNTIDVYDVDTFELLRTVTFDEDMTGTAVIAGGR
jgi:DNA-binding beta-propeller fold protein YncE